MIRVHNHHLHFVLRFPLPLYFLDLFVRITLLFWYHFRLFFPFLLPKSDYFKIVVRLTENVVIPFLLSPIRSHFFSSSSLFSLRIFVILSVSYFFVIRKERSLFCFPVPILECEVAPLSLSESLSEVLLHLCRFRILSNSLMIVISQRDRCTFFSDLQNEFIHYQKWKAFVVSQLKGGSQFQLLLVDHSIRIRLMEVRTVTR